jgi:cell wall-associated NlpC family hydrolase
VQAAYKAAGVTLPRVAQDQFDATTHLAPGDTLEPGDLVFFGGGTGYITHIGIYIGNGDMVDAPNAGADVRVEPYGWADFVGASPA